MKAVMCLCLFLLSSGAGAQAVTIENDAVLGLPPGMAVEYGGATDDGQCFIITRPAGADWDTLSYAKVYDGKCSEPLQDRGQPGTWKFRDGRTSFNYHLHPTPKGPDFDVIVISSNPSTPSQYKKTPFVFKKFKKIEP